MKIIKCGALIVNHNYSKILCILSHDTCFKKEYKWGLPKGHKENNESIIQCCKREIYEEIGINLRLSGKNHPFIHVFDTRYYLFRFNNEGRYYPKDIKEVRKVRWKRIKDLENFNKNRGLRAIIDSWDEIEKIFSDINQNNDKKQTSYNMGS